MKKIIGKRSPMYITISSRLLGVAVTIFILIITIKSELLSSVFITSQLVLSIPFFLGAMLTHAKIVDHESLDTYFLFNRILNAIAISFLVNALGLVITEYLSTNLGILFLSLTALIFLSLIFIKYEKRKLFSEGIVVLLIIALGILPALGII